MQSLLSLAIESVSAGFGAWLAAAFVVYLARSVQRPVQASATPVQAPAVEPPAPAAPAPADPVVEFVPNPDGFTEATPEEAVLVNAYLARYTAKVVPLFTEPPNLVAAPTPAQPATPDWAKLTPAQLRKECQQRQIKWRNAHGQNLHLKKAEMVALLSA